MKIAIITGGSGPERKTSIDSAKYISKNITFAEKQTFLYPEEYQYFLTISHHFDCVIPIIHGYDGEDGVLQKDLQEKNIKYIFSDSDIHKICFNKETAKSVISNLEYRTPKTYKYNDSDIVFPVICKPKESGSSIGIYLIHSKEELQRINDLEEYICEQYIVGREFTIGVIETQDGLHVLPVMGVNKQGAIFNNREKTTKLSQDIEVFPKDLEFKMENELQSLALSVHQKIGIKHLSRTDILVTNDNELYFIEVNTIPGCSKNSFIPKMFSKDNLNFSEILKFWIQKELK